jgi:anti-sigma-K factor RskA
MEPERDPPEDMTAAELALGVLDGEERAAALRRVLTEPAFAQDVEAWRDHFALLFEQWPEAAAPSGMLARIEESIQPKTATPGYWRVATGALGLIAASLLLVIVLRPAVPPPGPVPSAPVLVASLDGTGPRSALAAIYDPARGELRIPTAAAPAANRSAELWMIGSDGVPHSLGLLDTADRTVVVIKPADRAKLAPGLKLAVSSEPLGGSPTGLPTGPIVASGALISS